MGTREVTALGALRRWLGTRDPGEDLGIAESIMVLAALVLHGTRLDDSAYEGVGERWKEEVQIYFFNPNLALKQRPRPAPAAVILPHDLYAPLIIRDDAPFLLRRDDGVLRLMLDGQPIATVEYSERPAYYSRTTSTGVEMRFIGANLQRRALELCYNSYCVLFADDGECKFCNIGAERPAWTRRYNSYFVAAPQEAAEVALAAYSDGTCRTLNLTGGILPRRAEIPYLIEVGQALQGAFGSPVIPGGFATLTPPKDLEQIDELYAAGYMYLSFNLEVWDEHARAIYTPGKARMYTRDEWLAAMEHARDVAGPFRVGSAFVAGLEPMESLLEGVEALLQRGIAATPIPWIVMPGSALEGHQSPAGGWHLELFTRVLDLYERYGFPLPVEESGGNFQTDLALMRRDLAANAPVSEHDPRYLIAVKGRWPVVEEQAVGG
jgi:hypothetical protein